MKNKIQIGQSVLDDNGDVQQAQKNEKQLTVDIDTIAEWDRQTRNNKTHGNPVIMESIKRSIERKKKQLNLIDSETYNARLINYPTGQHVTLYENCIVKKEKPENLSRAYKNDNRTEKDIEHCIAVSMSRTKNNIYNIARSHEWKWFVTFTFARDNFNASDFDNVVKKMRKNMNHTKERYCPNLKYLIVPELHKDKTNYHFHGLLANCDELEFVFSGKFDKHGRPVFNIPRWSWGWSTATLVGDTSKASGYICKYVTKETERYLFGKRRYFSNAKKTEGEKLVVIDAQEFIQMYAEDITYMKDVYIPKAHQHVRYFEMPYKSNNTET